MRSTGRSTVLVPLGIVVAAWLYHSLGAAVLTAAEASQATLTVASANLNFERTDYASLAAWLLSYDGPDVIALQEFIESAKAAVTGPGMLAAYPHRVLAPSDDLAAAGAPERPSHVKDVVLSAKGVVHILVADAPRGEDMLQLVPTVTPQGQLRYVCRSVSVPEEFTLPACKPYTRST